MKSKVFAQITTLRCFHEKSSSKINIFLHCVERKNFSIFFTLCDEWSIFCGNPTYVMKLWKSKFAEIRLYLPIEKKHLPRPDISRSNNIPEGLSTKTKFERTFSYYLTKSISSISCQNNFHHFKVSYFSYISMNDTAKLITVPIWRWGSDRSWYIVR